MKLSLISTKLPIWTFSSNKVFERKWAKGPIMQFFPILAFSIIVYAWMLVWLSIILFLIIQPGPILTLSPKITWFSKITPVSISTFWPCCNVPLRKKWDGSFIMTPLISKFSICFFWKIFSKIDNCNLLFIPNISS